MHNDWNIAVIHIHKNIYRDDQNKNNNILGWSGNEHIVILTMPDMNMNIVTIVVTRIISLGLVGVCMVVSTYEIWRGPPTVLSHPSPMKGQLEPSSRWDKHQDKWVSELDGMECQPWLTSTGWTNTHTDIYTDIYIYIYIWVKVPKKWSVNINQLVFIIRGRAESGDIPLPLGSGISGLWSSSPWWSQRPQLSGTA